MRLSEGLPAEGRAGRAGPPALLIILAVLLLLPALRLSAVAADEADGSGLKTTKTIRVTSDTMEAERKKRLVIFRGDVVAEEDYTVCSDELYVYYDDAEEIKEIVAKGNVRVVQEGKRAKGDRAVFNRLDRTLVITGHAAAKQCSDIVRGERITFYLDSDNIRVEGRKGERVRALIMRHKECSESLESEEFRCRGSR